jgi:DNA-binding transcriptional LysR family regulator
MHFTLRQLEYFIAAGEACSIRKASEIINVSQPAISSAISQLEASFKLQLFIRHHAQGLSLTPAGTAFLLETKQFLAQGTELKNVAVNLSSKLAGTVQVGAFSVIAPIVMPELLSRFLHEHEHIDVLMSEASQPVLLEKLKRGALDIALTYDLHLPEDVDFIPLMSLSTYLLMGKSHPLASRESLSLEEVIEERFVLLDLPLSREFFLSMFIHAGLKPWIYTRTEHPDVVRGLVGRGFSYSLANVRPKNQWSLDGSELVYVPLKGDHPPLNLGLATLTDVRRTRALEAFVLYCQKTITQNSVPGMTGLTNDA